MLDLILEVCDELRVGIVVLELLEVSLELPKALLIALLAEPDLVAVQPDLLAVLPVEQVDVEARKLLQQVLVDQLAAELLRITILAVPDGIEARRSHRIGAAHLLKRLTFRAAPPQCGPGSQRAGQSIGLLRGRRGSLTLALVRRGTRLRALLPRRVGFLREGAIIREPSQPAVFEQTAFEQMRM